KIQVDVFLATYLGYYYKINASGGSEDESVNSIEGLPDGGYISVGSTLSFGSIGEDVYFIRHDSTIISYSSVVGVKEIPKNDKPYILYKEDKINVILRDVNGSSVELIDLNGKQIYKSEIKESDKDIEIEMSKISPAIYILRFRFKNGEVYNSKIIYK
ncbi:MAG: T9SS type A sorting domain-containing protein, partial [Bacteroidia bacterium]